MVEKAKTKGRGKKPSGTPRRRGREAEAHRARRHGAGARRRRRPSWRRWRRPSRGDGGAVLATYREPLGGHALMLAALPLDKVVPTPFQRDISDAHVRRLTQAMDKTQALPGSRSSRSASRPRRRPRYWTPERLPPADRAQGAGREDACWRCWCPSAPVAYQILALNIEKAHNLREKAIGVRRMYRDLGADRRDGDEESLRARVRGAGAGDARASPTRSGGGCRAARTTRSCARSTAWLPGQLGRRDGRARASAPALLLASTRR